MRGVPDQAGDLPQSLITTRVGPICEPWQMVRSNTKTREEPSANDRDDATNCINTTLLCCNRFARRNATKSTRMQTQLVS